MATTEVSSTPDRVPPVDEPVQPPGYDEVVMSTRYPVLRTSSTIVDLAGMDQSGQRAYNPAQHPGSRSGSTWQLKFVDFTPHLSGQNPRSQVTSFDKLIERANTWLRSNKHVTVVTCETVTWCAEDLRRLNDTDVVTTTIKKGKIKKTFFLRGLRLWVTPRQDSTDDPSVLGVREYTSECTHNKRGLEQFNVQNLVRTANNKLWEHPISGDIVNIETVLQPTSADTSSDRLKLKVKDTYWTDGAKVDRKYVPIVRVYYIQGENNLNVEIGMTDILPRVTKQDGRPRYEHLESMMIRASEWSANQYNVNVTNVQTVTYRRKGLTQGVGYPVFWASAETEDACVRILRIAYTKHRTMVTLRVLRPHHNCIRKKTFAPKRSPLSVDDSNHDRHPDDLKYQSFTKTVEEVSAWIDKSASRVLSVQTLRCQVADGKYHTTPDSSLVRPSDEKSRELIALVRVYIKANSNSSLCLSGPASLLQNSVVDRPFRSRSMVESAPNRSRGRYRWRHAFIVCVVLVAMAAVGIVIFFLVGRTRSWF